MDDLVELEFRDGKRWVPAYLANMMENLETYRMTYDEARHAANGAAVEGFVQGKVDRHIEDHFRKMR